MLRVYKKIDHKIFGIQKLVEVLVIDIFCRADTQRVSTKINKYDNLKKLYENTKSAWFRNGVTAVYKVCKILSDQEKQDFINVFRNNNDIENLCANPSAYLSQSNLNVELLEIVCPFFKDFYKKLAEWEDIKKTFETKKNYYDALIEENKFVSCPCCGYGVIKTIHEHGHSAFDHYLPLKYYPFSAVNFNNLFPLCHECNSDYKGENDILKMQKKVFYPAANNHPSIKFSTKIDPNSLLKLLTEEKFSTMNLQLDIIYDQAYQEEIESWDAIFSIKKRYEGIIKSYGISWLDKVRIKYRRNQDKGQGNSFEDTFTEIIEDDSNDHLGFLKTPFLSELKSHNSIIRALIETKDSCKIEKTKPIL